MHAGFILECNCNIARLRQIKIFWRTKSNVAQGRLSSYYNGDLSSFREDAGYL